MLSEIQHNCTRAAIIREGKIIACDSVDALAKNNARRVTVHGSVDLSGLDGIRDMQEKADGGGTVSFLYSGEMKRLLQTLSAGQVTDLSVAEPDLYDRELQDSYGVATPEDLLLAMVDDPGEYNDLAAFVQKFQGFNISFDDKVDEAKN